MKHIIDGVEWPGFQRVTRPASAPPESILVIAWFDGEPELWAAEGPEGIESLRQYYRAEWGDRDIPFTLARVGDPTR
jgi:hypothetical protein